MVIMTANCMPASLVGCRLSLYQLKVVQSGTLEDAVFVFVSVLHLGVDACFLV